MKKVLNNVFKWLLLVWISYSLMFTGIINLEQLGLADAIAYRIQNMEGSYFDKIDKNELEEICNNYQKMADRAMNDDQEIINAEYLSESEKMKQLEYNELYRKYPSGYTMVLRDVVDLENVTDLHITAIVMGIAIGTAIYLILDKDKKGLKVIISLYVIFVILLGFIEGIQTVSGDNLTLLDRWVFPETYIIPVTGVFILAIVTRVIRQKDIAKKLNEKLKERKEEKNK